MSYENYSLLIGSKYSGMLCNSSGDHFEFGFVKKTPKVKVVIKISIASTQL